MLKAIIDGIEILSENSDGCYIASATLFNNACYSALEIGATASDMLTLNIANPFKESFDGSKVLLYWKEDETESRKDELIDEVGESTSEDLIIEDDDHDEEEDDGTDGDSATSAEIADADAEEESLDEDLNSFMEGETATDTVEEVEPSEFVPLGVFYVYSQNTLDGLTTLTCLDGFVKLSDIYTPTNAIATPQQMWDDIKSKLSGTITLDDHSFSVTDSINWNASCSYRDAIGYLAGLEGGFATFGSDETVGISFYSFSDNIVLESEMTYCTYSASGETTIGGFTCNGLSAGYGQVIAITNPYMMQSALDSILARYKGVKFYGGSFNLPWSIGLQAGEFFRIMTDDEFKQYLMIQNAIAESSDSDEITSLTYISNALGKMALIAKQAVTFSDFATTFIESVGATQTSVENPLPQPIANAIANASATATNYITEDATGALVIARDVDDGNVRIDADSVEVRIGDEVFGTFTSYVDESGRVPRRYTGIVSYGENGEAKYLNGMAEFANETSGNSSTLSASKLGFSGGDGSSSYLTATDLSVTTVEATNADFGGDVSVAGELTGNIYPNFAFTSETIATSKSVAAEGYTEGTTTISKSGYYPVGVIGTTVNTRYCVINRAYIDTRAKGSGKLNWMIANHHSSAHTVTANVHVLWLKG